MSLKDLLKSLYPYVAFFSSLSYARPKFVIRYSLLVSALTLAGGFGIYLYILKDLPSPRSLASQPVPLTTHIRDRNGLELYKIYKNQNRTLVPLDRIPQRLRQAILAIEDKDFYRHRGFSPSGFTRAVYENLKNLVFVCKLKTANCKFAPQGGSTITQQLVKTSLLSPERTVRRKLRELVLSLAVEGLYSKDKILEMYLNRVSFGGSSYGVEEASQTYFGKSVSDLDLAQSAFLAGLPASPTSYSPYGPHPEKAMARQKEVLRRMVYENFISWDQAQAAAAQLLKISPPKTDIKAPHFVMYVKELLAQKYGSDVVEQGGLDVTTSLDLALQEHAQSVVAAETAKVSHLNIKNGAALVTIPQTGEILAMVGSRDYFDIHQDGQVNVTLALRQPGSAIKPVNYALAFSRGFTPASIIDDSPITYRTPGQPDYRPVNYDGRYHGRVALRTALASSYNIPAVKLLAANGVGSMIDLGQKLGISSWTDPRRFGLSLTLGGGEVTMLDLATVYNTLANGGAKVDLHPVLAIRDSRGRLVEEFRCPPANHKSSSLIPSVLAAEAAALEVTSCPSQAVLDPGIAFLISDILSDNAARTPAFGPRSDLFFPSSPVAVKTGTTNNLRDNWTIGYTPNRLVAVWVGNNDATPMSYVASGVTGASPIWRRIMAHILASSPSAGFTPPPAVNKLAICPLTGQLACASCPGRPEYFLTGTEPKSTCTQEQIEALLHPSPTPLPPRPDILTALNTFSPTPTPSPIPQPPPRIINKRKPRQ